MALGVQVIGVHGPNQHAGPFGARLDPFDEIDAVARFQGNIDDDDVRLRLGETGESVGEALGFTANFEVAVCSDEMRQARADNGVIIDHEDTGAAPDFCLRSW